MEVNEKEAWFSTLYCSFKKEHFNMRRKDLETLLTGEDSFHYR